MAEKQMNRLLRLCHHRWGPAVLAQLHKQHGARFVVLANTLDISRGALRQTLDAMIDAGWVRPNPGYGHPLRPEYILTADGGRVAPVCTDLQRILSTLGVIDVALRKWALPTILALGAAQRRFGDLKARLPAVTDRALTLTLKDLLAAQLVTRHIADRYPPIALYANQSRTRPIVHSLGRL